MSCKLALVLSAFGPMLAAQPALEGTVTDSIRQSGIAGVSVQLTSSNHEEHETTTDEGGRFLFNDLPAGSYTVVLGKEGYIAADGSDEYYGRLPVVRPGTERVSLEMLPLSQLQGRVLHFDGTAALGVELLLERAKFTHQTTVSGGDGAFAFNVPPGSYYLRARPKGASPGNGRMTEAVTYYPEAGDFSGAQQIIVGAGSLVSGIDIHLRSISLYRLSGVVVNDSGEQVKATVELRRKISSGSAPWLLISRGAIPGASETRSIYSQSDSTSIGEPYATAASDDGRFTFSAPEGEWIVHANGGPTEISEDSQLVGDVAVVVPSEHPESLQIPLEHTFDLKAIAEVEGGRNGHWMVPRLVLRSSEVGWPSVSGGGFSLLNLPRADGGEQLELPMLFDQVRAGSYRVLLSADALMTGLYLVGFFRWRTAGDGPDLLCFSDHDRLASRLPDSPGRVAGKD